MEAHSKIGGVEDGLVVDVEEGEAAGGGVEGAGGQHQRGHPVDAGGIAADNVGQLRTDYFLLFFLEKSIPIFSRRKMRKKVVF